MKKLVISIVVATLPLVSTGPIASGAEPASLFSPRPVWTAGTRNSGGDGNARWLDADQDGDLDLVTSLPGPRRWVLFKNEGGQLASTPSWESTERTDCDHISVLDFNGDGLPDLAGTHESHCTLYLNQIGSDAQPFLDTPSWETGVVTDANQIDFGDFDNDGDLDMLMASGLPWYGLALFENEGGSLARKPSARIGAREYSETAIFADVDADGDLDVVAAYGKLGTVYVYTNDDGQFDDGTQIYSDQRHPWCQRLYCLDLDGDREQEILLAKGPWGPPGPSVLLTRDSDSKAYKAVWRSGERTGYHGFDFADVDQDGDLDVAAADWSGRSVAIFLQADGQLPTTPSWTAQVTGPAHEVHLGDLDNDGDLDLAVGGVDQASVFQNRLK